MTRSIWIHGGLAIIVAIAALLVVRLHHANGAAAPSESVAVGHRLAEAWCKNCHAIEAASGGVPNTAPDFAAVANQPSTTALSLKVFLQSNHRAMPNLMLTPSQADDLVSYILSLKRD
jgi:mono/diheme cytochrome c family protein